jgi:hypothetical protein
MAHGRWLVVNIPGVGSIDMRKLIGESPARIVAYSLPKGTKGVQPSHMRQYLFDFLLTPK